MENLELVLGAPECSIQSVVSVIVEDAKVIKKWTSVARALDIPNAEITQLQQDLLLRKISYSDLLHDVLEKWVGIKGKDAKLVMLILVMEEGRAVNAGESIKLHFNLPTSIYDTISLEILPKALQVKAMNNLHKLIPNLSIETIKPHLKGIVLVQLVKGVPQTLPECLNYYVHRTVLTKNVISPNIFENCPPHIFLISGIEKYNLSKYARNRTTDNSTSQILQGKITVKHFDIICELTSDPVHWFSFQGNKLKWIQSRGGIDKVQEFVDRSQDKLQEKDFVTSFPPNSNNPICISDSPGMGKSMFLAEIGRKLVALYPERTVIFLVLGELITTVKKIDIKCLLHQIMKNTTEHGVTIELLLDGFDEVDPSERDFAHELLGLVRNCKSVRMWVTSRPHLLKELERTLDTIGFNIQPFSNDDQLTFLTSYWVDKNPNIKNHDKLTTFAEQSLTALKSTMNSEMSDIAGIPLQCLLIAEVYEDEASAFSNSEQSTSTTILITSITELYQSLIHQKLKKGGWTENITVQMDVHARLALELIFPEQFKKPLFGLIDVEEILKIGICQVSNHSTVPRFLHRTFAEYFVAWYVKEKLENWIGDGNIFGFFITRVLKCSIVNFAHDVITYFLNSLLESHPTSFVFINKTINQQQNVLTNDFLIEKYPDIAKACVHNDRLQIFKWLMKLGAFDVRKREIFDKHLLFQSMHYSSLEFVKILLEQFEEHYIFDVYVQGWCLRAAVEFGRFSIVEFLIKERQLHRIVQGLDGKTRTYLHVCVFDSLMNSPLQIFEKIQIIRMLCNINPTLVDTKDEHDKTPLVTERVHIRLKIELIRLGANVLNVSKYSQTVLHLEYGTMKTLSMSTDYHSLIMSIPKKAVRTLVRAMDSIQRTIIHRILYYFDPIPATLDVLKKFGADFNHVDKFGNVPLRMALMCGRDGATIRKLIECGSDVHWKEGETGRTLLHYTAGEKYSDVLPESIAVLLEWIDADVRDLSEKTPMDFAMDEGPDKVQRFKQGLALAGKSC